MSFTYQLAHQHQNLPYTRMMMIKPQTMIEHQLPASNKHQSNMFNSNHDHHLQQIYQRQQLFNMNNNNNNHYDNNQSIIKLNQHYLINNNNNYDSTAVQEIKMKKLRLLKEQICKQRQENRNKCNELETFKLIFKQKENELSIALNKIDTLTKQLDDIIAKNNNHNHNNNASSNPNIAIQLANLKQELLFKTNLCKQNDEQLSRKQNLLHKRQSDMICIDQRIKDLQCRLLRKKIINHKLKLLQQQSNHSNDDYKQNGHQSTFKQIAMGQISDGSNPINNRESFERLKMDHSLRYSFSNTANNQRPIQTTKQKANHSNGSNSNDDINKELQKNRIDLNASLKNEKISVIINEDDDEDVMMMMMMKNDHHHNVHNLEERPSPSGSSGSSDRISSSLNTYANIDDSSPEHDHSNKSNCRHLQLNQMISSKSDDNRNAKLDKLSSKTIDFHQPDKNNTFSHRFISIAKCNTAKNNHHLDESIGKSCTTSNKPAKLNANAISDINNKDLQESMQHDDDDNININNNNNNNSNNDSNDNDYENNNNNNNGNSNNNNNNTNIYNNDNNENTATQQNDDSIVSEENRIEGNRSDNNEPPNNGIVNKSNNLSSDESWKMMKRRPVYNLKEMENELLQLSSAHKQNQCTNDYCHDTIDHSVHITTNNNTTDAQQIVDDCLNNNSFSSLKLKTNLKKDDCQNEQQQQQPKTRPKRVSFDPLALLLDASLEGELELVKKTAGQVLNPSASNDEGITPLHNATCAGHLDIVKYLVEIGCDVNVQDSDGWTPLHCAASCNNLAMIKFLVKSGACIFATTFSDMETAAEKCEEEDEGFDGCCQYLYGIQDKLGVINNGIVYALYDYDAVNHDELTFKQGQPIQIIRKGDDTEKEWWWAKIANKEGYIPRNLIGLYPRVKDLCHQSVSSN